MRRSLLTLVALFSALAALAQPAGAPREVTIAGYTLSIDQYLKYLGLPEDDGFRPSAWGDQGNGTYINPILCADYSDPDAIRVGDRYYMVASDFHFTGMQLLTSEDLVNWRFVTQIYRRFDYPGWEENMHYGNGSWAPSIRYHDGTFYVFFCTPKEGLFMTSAPAPEGPWSKLLLVHEGAGWEDPCPFWDEDGQAYLGHSLVGAGPIILHKMSADGTRLLDEGVEVYRGPVAEGTKIHKWNGRYYMSIPEGGVGQGNQVILRSSSLYGPYDKKVVLEKGSTRINGPHQGAIVDAPDSSWWFLHFQQTPVLGRVVHLQPMQWEDDWPVIGVDIDRNGVGEPVYAWEMPANAGKPCKPASSDTFSGTELSPQWQFNHNPVDEAWSLAEKPGYLTLHALKADAFVLARNTVTQKLMGYAGTVTATLDLSAMQEGQRCGVAAMGMMNYVLGIRQEGGKKVLYMEGPDGKDLLTQPWKGSRAVLGFSYDAREQTFQFRCSADGKSFRTIGDPFITLFGNWKGARPAIFTYNTLKDGGRLFVDRFDYVE